MALIFLLLLLETNFSSSQQLWCLKSASSNCESCSEGYNFEKAICLALCPTGYRISANTCQNTYKLILFNLNAGILLPFNSKSMLTFYHPLNLELRDSGKNSPIMTKDRGLYFQSSSSLISNTSWVMSPRFSISLSLRIYTEGVIFLVSNKNERILEVSGNSSHYQVQLLLNNNGENKTVSLINQYEGPWAIMFLSASQSFDKLRLKINKVSQDFHNHEFRSQIEGLTYSFGKPFGTSFQGFLYDGFFHNNENNLRILFISKIMCAANEYYFNLSCHACDGTCGDWPWCVRESCNLCSSQNCENCEDFSINSCRTCSNGQLPYCETVFKCLAGQLFNCSQCESEYFNINGRCLVFPYNYNPNDLLTPVINAKFVEFKQFYDIFQSGSNASTFAPYNNTEDDDPIPLRSRGMTFNGENKYLKSKIAIALNIEFSISIWINTFYQGISFDKESLEFLSNLGWKLDLTNHEETIPFCSDYTEGPLNRWINYFITTNLNSSIFTLSYSNDFKPFKKRSIEEYSFYDFNSTIFIGNYKSKGFYGMIYWIAVWQKSINDISLYDNPCLSNGKTDCFIYCHAITYYSEYDKGCLYCPRECSVGCFTFGMCGQCSSKNCIRCSSYESNAICYETSSDYCMKSHSIASDGNCCHTNCDSCYGNDFYKCFTCSFGFVKLRNSCVGSCPLGFANDSNECFQVNSTIIDVTFDKLSAIVYNPLYPVEFTVANKSFFYPKFSVNNPIPSKNRGYYFGPKSWMSTGPLDISYNLTFCFWIRILVNGRISDRGRLVFHSSYIIHQGSTHHYVNQHINTWQVLRFKLKTISSGIFQWNIITNGINIHSFSYYTVYIYYFLNQSLVLGHDSQSFTGFLYKFTLHNGDFVTSPYSGSLSVCSFFEFEVNSSCYNCSNSCNSGCINNNTCNLCFQPLCEICSSFLNDTCLKCDNSSILNNNNCECIEGSYWNQTLQRCQLCSNECLGCSGSEKCTKCRENETLVNDKCYCKESYFRNSTFPHCIKCLEECQNCQNGISCTECKDKNSTLDIKSKCICKDGFFGPSPCKPCLEECRTCTDNSSCTSCNSSITLLNSFNRCACKAGFYYDDSCQPCMPECKTCIDGKTCTECKSLNSNLSSDYQCECLKGFFKRESECFSCLDECLDCVNESTCTSCKYRNTYINSESRCSCLDGFFLIGASCSYCLQECKTCKDGNSCKSCVDDFAELDIYNRCKCKRGYYNDGLIATHGSCKSCPYYCLTCISSTVCTSCSLKNTELFKGKCICKDGSYLSNPQLSNNDEGSSGFFECLSCLSECKTCDNPLNCTSCKEKHAELDDYGLCKCIKGYYSDDLLRITCVKCENGCLECNSSNYCIKCSRNNTEAVQGLCECINGYYFDKGSCLKCPDWCRSCSKDQDLEDRIQCSSCFEGFRLISGFCDPVCGKNQKLQNHTCTCLSGYIKSRNECVIDYFKLKVQVSPTNQIFLMFESEPRQTLTNKTFQFSIKVEKFSYKFLKIYSKKYIFSLAFHQNIEAGTKFSLTFLETIYSKNNETLDTNFFEVQLFRYLYIEPVFRDIITKSKAASQGLTLGSFALLILSNPSAAWALLSTMQMISFLPLAESGLSPTMVEFCTAVGSFNVVPNLMEYFVSQNLSTLPNDQARKIGIKSSVFLLNIGQELTSFVALLVLWPVFFVISRINVRGLNSKIEEKLNDYKYNFFLRFWMQSFLSFGVFAIINYQAVRNNQKALDGRTGHFFSSVLSCAYLIAFILTPVGLLVFFLANLEKICAGDNFLVCRFGTVFDEFKYSKGLKFLLYYPLFTLRRVFFVFAQVCLNDFPIFQKSLNLFFALAVFLLIVTLKPFKEKLNQISNAVSEGLFCIIFSEILMIQAFPELLSEEFFNLVFICAVLISMFCQYMVSLIEIFKIVKQLVEKRRNLSQKQTRRVF